MRHGLEDGAQSILNLDGELEVSAAAGADRGERNGRLDNGPDPQPRALDWNDADLGSGHDQRQGRAFGERRNKTRPL